jgi:UDP-GlcNAc3NAcA epimerase
VKILTIIGARPQFIKSAAVSRVVRLLADKVEEIVIHTGQHFDQNMSEIFFREMDIPTPKYNLDIHGINHGAMTGRMLEGIEAILLKEKPDWVLIYGDTNSTLAGALAASKLGIKVAHIEAGLRSFNNKMPEELNRIVADRLSTILFCPTQQAISNLEKEGYSNFPCEVVQVGDVMLDAALFYGQLVRDKAMVAKDITYSKFALCTIHRAENTDDSEILREIVEALNKIHSVIPVVIPLHPRTRKKLEELNIQLRVHILNPLGYFDMLSLLKRCQIVLTDSGGLQKEAYFFCKPCVTFRNETEWGELVDCGVNKLAGTSSESIFEAAISFLANHPLFSPGLYGDGKAAEKIIETLLAYNAK